MRNKPLPLTRCGRKGNTYRVCNVCCGDHAGRRLWEMGIYPGVELEVVQNEGGGPIFVKVEESRYGLGRGMAEKIMVCCRSRPA